RPPRKTRFALFESQSCGSLLDKGSKSGGRDAEARGASDEVGDVLRKLGKGCSRCRHGGSATAAKVDQTLIAQLLISAQHGVQVDVECLGDLACRRESIA